MILAGVVGLFPPAMFGLLALWLVTVALFLMFRPVGAAVAGRSALDEPTEAAQLDPS